MEFEKHGYFWRQPLHRQAWLNVKYWFAGLLLFLKCLKNYDESIKGNDFTIPQAWGVCFAIQEMRMGKTYKMIDRKEGDA